MSTYTKISRGGGGGFVRGDFVLHSQNNGRL